MNLQTLNENNYLFQKINGLNFDRLPSSQTIQNIFITWLSRLFYSANFHIYTKSWIYSALHFTYSHVHVLNTGAFLFQLHYGGLLVHNLQKSLRTKESSE